MKKLKPYALFLVVLLICLFPQQRVFAQYKNQKDASIPLEYFYVERQGISPLRRILSKVHFGLSTGFARTNFKHELSGYGVLQPSGGAPLVFSTGDPSATYSNWFNRASTAVGTGTQVTLNENVAFKSRAFSIPLRGTVHYEFDRYRIGGGYSFEYTNLGDFNPLNHQDQINGFKPEAKSFFLKRYFVLLGASVYRYEDYLLVVDANIGGYKLGKKFDGINKSLLVNVGVTIEREMSEYFKLFVRPSYDLKSYTLGVPQASSIKHKLNAVYINVGATYRIPELRRCYEKTCRAQKNHAHGNREYRSRVHPIHKKQNPHYGENYPELIKYKGKNKYKLNPY